MRCWVTADLAGYLRFRPEFARTIDDEGMTFLDKMVEAGFAQTWAGEAGAIITALRFDGERLFLDAIMVGGDRTEIVETLRPKAEVWGRQIGCAYVFTEGRLGWGRVLAPHGYTPFRDGLRKEL